MKSLLDSKKEELKSLDENIINNINIILESIEENKKLEEYKGLLISKDNEISKLNDINISKENEIKRLNNLIEEIKKGSAIQELEENFKKEKEQLLSKINNLELKIYNLKEEKEKLITEENINNKEETYEEENTNKQNNKLSYEELMKIKEDIEQKNQELVVEIKLLKDNQEPNEINNEDSLKKLKELEDKISEYEAGKIIPEITQKKFDEIQSQVTELLNQNKILNEKVNIKTKTKKEFEIIIFKQESKISELSTLIKKKDLEILSKDTISNKNQIYSVQLMNIINEQKIKIEQLKQQNKEEQNTTISELKREINNLENILELKESIIQNMKKTYRNLQDKYIKMTFNIKRKEQDDLLNQAKILNLQRKERNKQLFPKKNYSNNFSKKIIGQANEDLNNLSAVRYSNFDTSPKSIFNKKSKNKILENDFKNSNDVILPIIKMNYSENIDNNNNDLMLSGEKNKLEEINDMMKQVIENENDNKEI